MWVLVLEVDSARRPVPGWGSLALVGPCQVTWARSWLGRSRGNAAGWGGYLGTCENRAEARKHPSHPSSHLSPLGFLPEWETPVLALLCFGSFLGLSQFLHANPAPHHLAGTQSRATAFQGVITDVGRGFYGKGRVK